MKKKNQITKTTSVNVFVEFRSYTRLFSGKIYSNSASESEQYFAQISLIKSLGTLVIKTKKTIQKFENLAVSKLLFF